VREVSGPALGAQGHSQRWRASRLARRFVPAPAEAAAIARELKPGRQVARDRGVFLSWAGPAWDAARLGAADPPAAPPARQPCRRSPGTALFLLARESRVIIRAEGASRVTM
jgi:hypothetical protein